MANFNIVIDTSAFKPFDISPALNILRDYRDAYYKYDEQLNKIAEENGQYVLPDTPEYAEYKAIRDKYNKDLYNVVSDFSRGMNVRNAQAIRDIQKRYYGEMLPMNKAIEAYNKDQDKMTALGTDAIIGNRQRSIRDYYGGINPGIDARSIKAIQSTAANVVAGIDNALMKAPNQAGSIASQYFVIRQKGLEGADALNAILKANPQLRTQEGVESTSQLLNALDRVYKQYAFKEGTPENAQIWENVVSGAIAGIQAPKYTVQKDESFETEGQTALREKQAQHYDDLRKNAELDRALKKAEAEAEGYVEDSEDAEHPHYTYDPNRVTKVKPETTKNPTPYLEHRGKKYKVDIKGNDEYEGKPIYQISDLETGQIIVDPQLKKAIIDKYEGKESGDGGLGNGR